MDFEKLIGNIKAFIIENNERQKEYLYSFNIFDICDIGDDEVKICRFLYELLNPNGRHLQGIKYLRIFIETVLKLKDKPSDDELENAIVKREEVILNNRRIDISIAFRVGNKKIYIPIEVKIYAVDQDMQCVDYLNYAKSNDLNSNSEDVFVYYLTPDGKLPSEDSAKGLEKVIENGKIVDYKGIQRISFRDDINLFLDRCLKKEYFETKYIDEHQVLKQFKTIVRYIGGLDMYNDNNKICDFIIKDKNTFESAKNIADNFQYALKLKCKEYFDAIYKLLKDDGWSINYSDSVDFSINGASIYKKNDKVNAEVAMEVWGNKPYYGVCPIDGGNVEDLRKKLSDANLGKSNSTWAYWSYFDDDICPNFSQLNAQFYYLFNENELKNIAAKCADCLKKYYNVCCKNVS